MVEAAWFRQLLKGRPIIPLADVTTGERLRPRPYINLHGGFHQSWREVVGSNLQTPDRNDIASRFLRQPIALAALWDRWRSKDKSETKDSFTIVTTEPSKFAAQFHNRMPLVLEPDTWNLWLEGDPEGAAALMKAANEGVLVSQLANKAVGNVKNNGPELLEALNAGT